MKSGNGTKTGKLAKLTQLEKEVARLSEQLKADKQTISLLKESLTERDLKIHELESKLNYAQQSLLKKTTFTIHQCRDQIKSGIDEKIINPALAQIQQQIEVIQGIVYEAKILINKKKMLLHENIYIASNRVHQYPYQALRYFEKSLIEPARLWVGLAEKSVKNGRDLVEQKIIYPGKVWFDNIIVVALALPTQSQLAFQVWLAEPVVRKIEALPVIGKGLADSLMRQLKSGTKQALAHVVDAVKKSPFWDGKRKMEAA
ncbi:MAG: hypothetical protein EPN17_15285 [Methylobacter sp.]|nr:MAG: hypothetical protein EPN17_15285 [Methylobacter sp.]